ncbi:baculoviral IAP repeat-containing protein 7-like [Haliotis cracherodii]|uniref:baculoviral IAP repeat-containing protein 7-like n=1 Tax=Haliotis cracherodii TaxID=6455 RepID=UPI0039E9417B
MKREKNYTKDTVILWCGMIMVVEVDRRKVVRAVFLFTIMNLKIDDQNETAKVFKCWKYEFPFISINVLPSISLRGDFDALVRRNGTLLQDIMRFEAMRLKSFNGVTVAVSSLLLAREGFYATGDGDETRCFSCGIRYKHWRQRDSPAQVHHKRWCRSGYHRNIPFEENPLPTDSEVQTRNRLDFSTDFDVHPPNRRPDESDRSHTNRAVCQNNIASRRVNNLPPRHYRYSDRLSTYRSWDRDTNIASPRDLAEAGFYFLGNLDRVQCFVCGIILRDWQPGDDPWIEHVRRSPRCNHVESVKGRPYFIQIMITIASRQIDEGQNTFSPISQTHELVKIFCRCLKLGFNQQEVKSAALRVLDIQGISSPSLVHLIDGLLRGRGSCVKIPSRVMCLMCRKDVVNTVFLPCGHKLACDKCASEMHDCPLISCGARIWGYLLV